MKQEFQCVGCRAANQSATLDLGLQPLANRFTKSPDRETEYRHPLVLAQCEACGLVQLLRPVPVAELRPRDIWIKYREPDFHFDEMAAAVAPLLPPSFSSLGLSHDDVALLERIHAVHPQGGSPPEAPAELGIKISPYGMETVQQAVSTGGLDRAPSESQHHDLLVARYVLEHAHDPLRFLKNCRAGLKPSGLLLLEVPHVGQPFAAQDYHVLWEEHTVYFLEQTLLGLLGRAGFALETQLLFPSSFEQPWVILARVSDSPVGHVSAGSGERRLAASFISGFAEKRRATTDALIEMQASGRRLMLFGAGHFAVAFVNFFNVEAHLTCVIDDDPNKVGCPLPGTALRIEPSSLLRNADPVTLIYCVNPEVEEKLKAKLDWFYSAGGASCSIFSLSPNYLLRSRLAKS